MNAHALVAASQAEFDAWIGWYQGHGFTLRWYQPPLALLVRSKRFSVGWFLFWLVVGWLFFLIPLIVFLVLYAVARDELVTIRIAESDAIEPTATPASDSPDTAPTSAPTRLGRCN